MRINKGCQFVYNKNYVFLNLPHVGLYFKKPSKPEAIDNTLNRLKIKLTGQCFDEYLKAKISLKGAQDEA